MIDSAALCPPAIMRHILEATLAWVDAQKKAGKILEVYAIPGGRTAVICNHLSTEVGDTIYLDLQSDFNSGSHVGVETRGCIRILMQPLISIASLCNNLTDC